MHANRVKGKIRAGQLAIGTYVTLKDPAVVEAIGLAGFDAAFIDMEHTTFDLPLIEEMIRACELVGITSVVRVPDDNPKTMLRILDAGAQGIQVPHIAGLDAARAVVKAVRYAPVGERGMANATRAARYGTVPLAQHLATSNAEVLLSLMVEDRHALSQLDDIAALLGVDLVAIGPYDLSAALGITDPRDPMLKTTIEDITARLKKIGKAKMAFPLGIAAYPLTATQLQAMGVGYCNCTPGDIGRLVQSFSQQVRDIRAELA